MARPSFRRAEKTSERSAPWLLGAVVVSVLAIAGAYLGIRLVQQSLGGGWRVTFLLISAIGFLSLALFLIAGFYTARKRMLQERVGGTMLAWLKSHIYLGAAALIAAIAHWLLVPLSGRLTSGKVALLLLAVLVISGLAWRLVYLRVPLRVPESTGNLSIRDSRERTVDYRIQIDKMKVGKSAAFQRAVDDLMSAQLPDDAQDAHEFTDAERTDWARVKELAAGLRLESTREKKQRRYARMLQAWRAVHLPLAIAAVIAVGFHLFDVFDVGRAFSGEADKQFASAEDCASCHADIVDEWKLSPHRMAQTSTITRAQTSMALQANPDFRKDCVNCHAPIGTKFSESTTFPVGDDPGLAPDSAGTEGITCVVCHTSEEHPDELEGFTDDLAVGQRGNLGLGTMFGPPLENPGPRANSAHDIGTGFMTDSVGSSQLCGACHNVIADVDGNGLAPAGAASAPNDSDEDGVLNENEIDADNDLVLQSTFNEWEDFLFSEGGVGPGCVDCHMPATTGPVGSGSPLIETPERDRNAHTFVGVDYELNTDYYEQPGMPTDALGSVLRARERLLRNAVDLTVDIPEPKRGVLTATVKLRNNTGHGFPTGFAFARQFWLEVSATSSSGEEVCLAKVEKINSSCGSGEIDKAAEDLSYCETQPFADDVKLRLISAAPAEDCDPWLVSFQKVLTDGDQNEDGTFEELPYQTKAGGVVQDRVRTVADPLSGNPQSMGEIVPKRSAKYSYEFDVSEIGDASVSVTVVLRHRHLAPYLVRALEPSFSEDDPSAADLLANMTVVDMASNKPLGPSSTSPSPEALAVDDHPLATSSNRPATSSGLDGWAFVPVLVLLLGVTSVRRGLRS